MDFKYANGKEKKLVVGSQAWKRRNLIEKAQNTLAEIHETAKAKRFERVIGSAGNSVPMSTRNRDSNLGSIDVNRSLHVRNSLLDPISSRLSKAKKTKTNNDFDSLISGYPSVSGEGSINP